jgi:ligand-binding sensor domain-containing protein
MKYASAFLVLMIYTFMCSAQEGDYFLTHHTYDDNRYDPENFDVEQDSNGLIYIANKGGVLRYDGRSWDLVRCPGSVYDVLITPKNQVYVAGKMGFGYLQYTTGLANASYIPLFSKVGPDGILKAEQRNDSIFFLSNQTLYLYLESTKTVRSIRAPESNEFTNMFFLSGSLLLQTQDKTIYTYRKGKLRPVHAGFPKDTWILFTATHPTNKSVSLIGTDQNELYWMRNGKATKVNTKDDGYIEQSELTSCRWISNNLIAIGTLRGGVVFLNATTGAIDKIVNYRTGLPDNEVYALGNDRDLGVWVAHAYGFTRIAPDLPFRCYSNFPGMEGNLLAVMPFENTLYVGTSTGMYFLNEVKDYQTTLKQVIIKGYPKVNKPAVKQKKPTTAVNQPVEDKSAKSKRKPFSFLRSKKKKEEALQQAAEVKEPVEAKKPIEEKKQKEGLLRRIFSRKPKKVFERHRELKSIRYTYKPVVGFSGKSISIKQLKGSLLSGGTGGLFEIKEGKASQLDGDNTLVFTCDVSSINIFSFTDGHVLKVFSRQGAKGQWAISSSLKIEDDIVHINRTNEKEVWLTGRSAVYQLKCGSDNQYSIAQTLPIENPFNDEVYSFVRNGKVYFIASHDCFYYDAGRKVLLHDREIVKQLGKIERVILSNENIWVFNGDQWMCLSDDAMQHEGLNVLGFFKQIQSLYVQHAGEFWVTTGTNELYRISSSKYSEAPVSHRVLLKEVRSKGGELLPVRDLQVDQDNSSLAFEFVHPDYRGLLGTQYQYKLNGLSDQWTAWTPNASLSYQLLPAGSYDLHVRIRDALGSVSEEQLIHFNVVPPYWKTSWFYLLEIIFFGALLGITFRLNRKESRYEFVTRILTFLTLILIIELIQNLAESYWTTNTSPVINFFVQAVIALLVYPIEKILRKFLSGKTE